MRKESNPLTPEKVQTESNKTVLSTVKKPKPSGVVLDHSLNTYTGWNIEQELSGTSNFKLYQGRDHRFHGAWLCTLSDFDDNGERTRRMIESAPRFLENAKIIIDSIPAGFEMPERLAESIQLLRECVHVVEKGTPYEQG